MWWMERLEFYYAQHIHTGGMDVTSSGKWHHGRNVLQTDFPGAIYSISPCSGSQLTGVTWVVDRANVMWAIHECGKSLDLETACEIKFHLGLSSALLPGAAHIFFDLLCFVSKMGTIPHCSHFPRFQIKPWMENVSVHAVHGSEGSYNDYDYH